MNRREFLQTSAIGIGGMMTASCATTIPAPSGAKRKPNVVFVFADQMRAQATGYAGDPNMRGNTPALDKLAAEGVCFSKAVSCCPVCTPHRACLLTGQYPLTHGLFLNDLCLPHDAVSIAEAYTTAGYDTAYIGKWHLDGHGRSNYIPPERRQGFDYWKVLECTHDYNRSAYYAGNDQTLRFWDGYDAIAQTRDAQQYIRDHANNEKPFLLFVSWGTPHNPYQTAPEKYKQRFDPDKLTLRPNVPERVAESARKDLAGYYAHIAVLDDCVADLLATLDATGVANDTIFVFTSDHGDMLGSQGHHRKQRPWDESIMVPFLLRYPAAHGSEGVVRDLPINTPDIMPTLLGLSGVEIPGSVEGTDYSALVTGKSGPDAEAALIACVSPFGEWTRSGGGKEYRGVRTRRYTYVKDLNGPWLLYDNETDPYQMENLANRPEHAELRAKMESLLAERLTATHEEFLHGSEYVKQWGHKVDESGTVPYR